MMSRAVTCCIFAGMLAMTSCAEDRPEKNSVKGAINTEAAMDKSDLEAKAAENRDVSSQGMVSKPEAAKLAWWRQARFGCFVHWGVYSELGNQWNGRKGGGYAEHIQRVLRISQADYKAAAIDRFNPVKFDAMEWIALAKRAGMRYFVITAKHHDGFAMYDSSVSDYNIVKQTPWKRDPMKELKAACDRQGIRFGLYYSHAFDWGEPDGPGNDWEWKNPGGDKGLHGREWWIHNPEMAERIRKNYVDRKSIPQIKELVELYQPDLLWFDTPGKLPGSDNQRILDVVRAASSSVVVNSRLVGGKGDYISTGDRAVEFVKRDQDWEAIPTTNESYGWNPLDNSHKTPDFLIRTLCKAVSRGGNILLNIGPRGDGSIDPKDVAILEGIGQWMDVNAEAIYGCGACDLPVQSWGVVTAKEKSLYLIMLDASRRQLEVAGLSSDPTKAVLITPAGGKTLEWRRINEQDVAISLPDMKLGGVPVVRLEFNEIPKCGGVRLLAPDGDNQLLAFDAVLHRGNMVGKNAAQFGYGDGKQNNYVVTQWTNTDQWLSWEVRLNHPAVFDLTLKYGTCRGGEYEVSCGDWKAVRKAKSNNGAEVSRIAPVTEDGLGRLELPPGIHQIRLSLKESNAGNEEALRPLELRLKGVAGK